VQHGPEGLYAWIVTGDGHASMRPLQAGPEEGTSIVVRSGMNAGDRVVTGGQSRLQDGAAVTISPDAIAAGEAGPVVVQ
jgi:multidrug efflux system membrane fusion protein